MKALKLSLVGLLITAVFVITATAHSHPGDPERPTPYVSHWAQHEVEKAMELGLVPDYYDLPEDYRKPITRQDFRKIAMQFIAVQEHYDRPCLQGMVSLYLGEKDANGNLINVFTDKQNDGVDDYDDKDNSIAYYLGVVEGRGNGVFDPEGLITRQEAAVMLTRSYVIYGGTLADEETETGFSDEIHIADWSIQSVRALGSWNVMNGMQDGSFSPEGQYSIEQCIVTFLRLYENAPVSRKLNNVTPLFTYEQAMGYIDNITNTSKMNGYGDVEKFRIEGPEATFVRMNWGGTMHASSSFYFLHRDGGITRVDLGICDPFIGFHVTWKLEDPYFSKDGKTFFCTMTLNEDALSAERKVSHEKGIYHITIDVETGQYQHLHEPLPS